LLRQIVKKSITLFIQLSEIDGGFVGFLLQKKKGTASAAPFLQDLINSPLPARRSGS
jgi:hypothetical protein